MKPSKTIHRLYRALALALVLAAFFAAGATERVDTIEVATSMIASPAKCVVAVPSDYDSSDKCYPSVYLLHGYSGNYADWSRKTDLGALADAYQTVIVCPDGRDSWYWNSMTDPAVRMESFIVEDLVTYIDDNYRTIDDPRMRAITGLSMGGQGAFRLGMIYPQIFANIGSMSGAMDITKFPNRWKIDRSLGKYADYPLRWKTHSLMNIVERVKPGSLNIIFDCGESDFFYEVNNAMDEKLTKKGIVHEYSHRPGNHTWDYWVTSLTRHLDFFSDRFKQYNTDSLPVIFDTENQ